MTSKRWWSLIGSLAGFASIVVIGLVTGSTLLAAEQGEDVIVTQQVECGSVDPGFAYELEETLRGLDDPGFFPSGPHLGTPTIDGSVDPGFWQPIRSCPIGPLEDALAPPNPEILTMGLTTTATPTKDE
jgi:hypothetical protein